MSVKNKIETYLKLVLIAFLVLFVGWQIHDLNSKIGSHQDHISDSSQSNHVQYSPKFGSLSFINLSESFRDVIHDSIFTNISAMLRLSSEYHRSYINNTIDNDMHSIKVEIRDDSSSYRQNMKTSLIMSLSPTISPTTKPTMITTPIPTKLSLSNITQQVEDDLCFDASYNLCQPIDNIFLPYVYHIFQNRTYDDIIGFNGQTVKRDFDPQGLIYGVSLGGRTASVWKDVAHLINQSSILQAKSHHHAIHLHNELKFGDLFEIIIRQHHRMKKSPIINEEDFHRVFDLGQPPIVITNSADENWGFLSTPINTRTTKWINLTNHLLIHGANYRMVQHFLSSPKIIGLPLGVKSKDKIYHKVIQYMKLDIKKKRLLLINNSGWRERSLINTMVSQAFDGHIINTYDIHSKQDHYRNIAESMFVLCPSGLGFDTYRLWETLLFGSIPIVESNAGFDRTYANLPVLVVHNFSDITPSLLKTSYTCFHRYVMKYRYEHLTRSYWMMMVRQAIESGNIDHVTDNHPYRNLYCNYLPA